tara:strand:- start:807 stop:2717 length:1911 start_codon:yes stop_codon:yes gene_type:complete
MPALWPKFIPDLANTIASQQFTKPGGLVIGYEPPIQISEVGNTANAALKSNPAEYINVFNPNPLSGRYDFGVAVAEHYIEAVKGYATTHVMATHTNNPAAELILKQGYGIAHERLLREGDIPMMDQYDEDGNLITMGKESHPAYADFCPEIAAPPTEEELAEIAKENNIAFSKFTADHIDAYNLYKFKFFKLPCLTGDESQKQLEVVFATRLLQTFEKIGSQSDRYEFWIWADHLGKKNYPDSNALGWSGNNMPYPNIETSAKNAIGAAGYNWRELVDNVSYMVSKAILDAHPRWETDIEGASLGGNNELKQRLYRTRGNDIAYPTLITPGGKDNTPEFCPINQFKLQVPWDYIEEDDIDNLKPRILQSNVIALFSWYPGKRSGGITVTFRFENEVDENGNTVQIRIPYVSSEPTYRKTNGWVRSKYEEIEFDVKWNKVPKNKLVAASQNGNPTEDFLKIDPKPEGTLFKFEYHKTKCAVEAANSCEEPANIIDFPFEASGTLPPKDNGEPGDAFAGDPYEMIAKVTIAYWYACIVKPFGPSPSPPPALIPPPLTGIYIPIYYGSANRLANNLRRAWNTGKTFSKIPAPQPPALAVSTAVAGAYALHLLEFKLLYLGGIPTPVGPIPMVGFVPIVF